MDGSFPVTQAASPVLPVAIRFIEIFTANILNPNTGITVYLDNGGILETAQVKAAHVSPRSTKLYDRRGGRITAGEVARIAI